MIFSALRMMEDGVLEEALTCRADDYENALHIARILLEHIIGVYNTLPHVSSPVKAPADARTFSKQKFWSDLPPQFDTQTFLQTASALAITPPKPPRNTSPTGARVASSSESRRGSTTKTLAPCCRMSGKIANFVRHTNTNCHEQDLQHILR